MSGDGSRLRIALVGGPMYDHLYRVFDAAEAHGLGLVNHVVPHEGLDAKVSEVAGKILANPKWAVRWTKTAANMPLRALASQLLDAAMAYELLSNTLADRKEAVAAFVEKRAPNLTGE